MLALRSFRVASRFASRRPASSLVAKFDESVNKLPMRDAVRYTDKNMRWTALEFNNYINSHASALLEFDIKAGDTIALWLPESAEKHVALMAAAKAGIKVVDVDIKLTEISEIRAFLAASNCKVIYFKPEHEEHDYLLLLRKAIPEFFEYDDSHGQMFHSKYFRSLKYFVHTGFDIENGCLNYKSLFLPSPQEDMVGRAIKAGSDSDIIYQQITKGSKGVEVGSPVPASKALELPSYAFARKIIGKEFFEF